MYKITFIQINLKFKKKMKPKKDLLFFLVQGIKCYVLYIKYVLNIRYLRIRV